MDKSEWIVFLIVGLAFFFTLRHFLARKKNKKSCCDKGCGPSDKE